MEATHHISVRSVGDLPAVARQLLQAWPKASIFAFYGEMGAGKTTFIKALSQYMGVTDPVSSPTFAIVNVYRGRSGQVVNHFDCYRMKTIEEFYDIGYEDYFFSGDPCFIEWPEKIEPLLPQDSVRVTISVDEKNGIRTLSF